MFPELTTERFLLRQLISSDLPKIYEGLSNPAVTRYYGVSYTTLESTGAQMDFYNDLLANETGAWWAICYKNNAAELIGACGFNDFNKHHNHIEIGYWLLPAYQGKGIMAACLPVIVQHAFEIMDVHRIVAVVETGNEKSSRLLQKLGFQYEGTHRDSEIKNGQYISLLYFALINPLH